MTDEHLAIATDRVNAVVYGLIKNTSDYEDFRQLALVRILEYYPRYDPERSPFAAYCTLVAKGAIHNEYKRRNSHMRRTSYYATSLNEDRSNTRVPVTLADTLEARETPDDLANAEHISAVLADGYDKLSEAERLCFALACCGDLTYEQVVEVWRAAKIRGYQDADYKMVDNAVQRARKKLRGIV